MEGRMTVCNMSIEGGCPGRHGGPRRHDVRLPRGPRPRPQGRGVGAALDYWRTLPTDDGATFDKEVVLDAAAIVAPFVTWGTNPAQVAPIDGAVPDPDAFDDPADREAAARALAYMGLEAGTPLREIAVDTVFLGSCTNAPHRGPAGRRRRARGPHGARRACAPWSCPGSHRVKAQAEAEGLDKSSRRPASSGASPAARCAWP